MTEKEKVTNSEWVYWYDTNDTWKYEITSVRYVLGEVFNPTKKKALICIGINPSTAIPEILDPTLKKVQKYAKDNDEYSAWYMINVYPQRATDPNDMDIAECYNETIHLENIRQTKKLLEGLNCADIWCAWGRNILKRNYLKYCLNDILKTVIEYNEVHLKSFQFVHKKPIAEKPVHPLHPIASIKTEQKLSNFNIINYIEQNTLCTTNNLNA